MIFTFISKVKRPQTKTVPVYKKAFAAEKDDNKSTRAAGKESASSWMLSNLAGNIRRVKERIAQLERMDSRPAIEDISFDGGVIRENTEVNRLQIIFDNIPDAEIRANLKRWGFKWSRSEQAWQRLRGSNALWAAKQICNIV